MDWSLTAVIFIAIQNYVPPLPSVLEENKAEAWFAVALGWNYVFDLPEV